jgi:2-methylisocitrate lyase-like PEP mutase family enzyme
MEEVAAVPTLVRGPCLLNVVHNGKTPALDLQDAERMGYRVAIVPGLLFKAAIADCDTALVALKSAHLHPEGPTDMTVRQAFDRVGAEAWGALRTKFRDPQPVHPPAARHAAE